MLGEKIRQGSLFKEFVERTGPKVMRVQKMRGSAEFVETTSSSCSCEWFDKEKSCSHSSLVRDLVENDFGKSKYLFKSAMHKELRRGDVKMALHWAGWFGRAYSPTTVKEYLRKIWSEETMNLDLAVRLHGGRRSVDEMVRLFCASRKRWEFDVWDEIESYWRFRPSGMIPIDPWYEESVLKRLVSQRDADVLEQRLLLLEDDEDEPRRQRARLTIVDAMAEEGLLSEDQAGVFRKRYKSGRLEDEDLMLVAITRGVVPDEASEYREDRLKIEVDDWATDERTIMFPPMYAYDYHVVPGRIMIKKWKNQNPDKRIWFGVDTSPVDLRWAGGLVPLFWRYEAWAQAGEEMDKMKWHELRPNEAREKSFDDWCEWRP